jgi:hypothetical protein
MNDRPTKRILSAILLASALSLSHLAEPTMTSAAVQEPLSAEPRPSARRTAARAIERRTSTQWLSDVAERLRVLEEHAERAATQRDASSGVTSHSPAQGRNLR